MNFKETNTFCLKNHMLTQLNQEKVEVKSLNLAPKNERVFDSKQKIIMNFNKLLILISSEEKYSPN